MNKALLLAVKDVRVILNDKGNIFWVFGFPVIFALFFGAIFSGMGREPSGMKIAVVDEDESEFSKLYLSKLESSESLETVGLGREEALDQVRRGKVSAAVMLKSGFGDGFGAIFAGGDSKLEIASDPARRMESAYLQGLLAKAQFEVLAEGFANRDWMRNQVDTWREQVSTGLDGEQARLFLDFFDSLDTLVQDVEDQNFKPALEGDLLNIKRIDVQRQSDGPASPFQITFPQAMIWAILGCTATFAISIVKERTNGTFARLRVAPLGRTHILGGKGLACFGTCAFVMCIQWIGAKLIFKMPVDSPLLLVLAGACTISCFAGFMMFVSTLGRTEQSVGGAGWAMLMIMAMLGGGMIPLFVMPPWLRPISHFSPVKWGIYALEGAIWRHFTLLEMLGPCLILLAIGTTFFALGILILRRQES